MPSASIPRELFDLTRAFSPDGIYVNSVTEPDAMKSAYRDETCERLVTLKNEYDPTKFSSSARISSRRCCRRGLIGRSVRTRELSKGKQPMLLFVNQSKFDTWCRYPYPLSIREPLALFDLYTGTLHVNVIVDVGAMSRKFASLGFRMAFEEAENIALTINNRDPAKPDRFDLALSPHFFERVAYEFLALPGSWKRTLAAWIFWRLRTPTYQHYRLLNPFTSQTIAAHCWHYPRPGNWRCVDVREPIGEVTPKCSTSPSILRGSPT